MSAPWGDEVARIMRTQPGVERLTKREFEMAQTIMEGVLAGAIPLLDGLRDDRDRYHDALKEIAKWRGADAGATQAADIAEKALNAERQTA